MHGIHRHLQRWMGTQARLRYAAFDVQLRKCILSLYCIYITMRYRGFLRQVLMI